MYLEAKITDCRENKLLNFGVCMRLGLPLVV